MCVLPGDGYLRQQHDMRKIGSLRCVRVYACSLVPSLKPLSSALLAAAQLSSDIYTL